MGFKFLIRSCETQCFFLRDSGREFQTVGPKTEKDLFPKVSRENRGTVSREVSRERSALEGYYRCRRSEIYGGMLF